MRQARHEHNDLEVNLNNQSQGSRVHNISIIFFEDDAKEVYHLYCNALVVTLLVANKCMYRILNDNEIAIDILFMSTNGSVVPKGVIKLTVSFGKVRPK